MLAGMHAGLYTPRSVLTVQLTTQPHVRDRHDALRARRKEESIPEDPTQALVEQDIIRMPELGVILTRFKCYGRPLSMLVRIRPGWEELARYLRTGLTEPGYALCHIWARMTAAQSTCFNSGGKCSLHERVPFLVWWMLPCNVMRNATGRRTCSASQCQHKLSSSTSVDKTLAGPVGSSARQPTVPDI